MSYLFEIVQKDAAEAVERLFREESVPPGRVLEELRNLQDELAVYIAALEEEVQEKRPEPRQARTTV